MVDGDMNRPNPAPNKLNRSTVSKVEYKIRGGVTIRFYVRLWAHIFNAY